MPPKSRNQKKQNLRKRRTTRRVRKQRGGEGCPEEYKSKLQMLNRAISAGISFEIPEHLIKFLIDIKDNLEECSQKYAPQLKDLQGRTIQGRLGSSASSNKYKFTSEYYETLFPGAQIPDSFYSFFGEKNKCSIKNYMEKENPFNECASSGHKTVEGSCGEPSFWSQQVRVDLEEEDKDKLLGILNAIEQKLSAVEEKPTYFDIVVGATGWHYANFPKHNNYTLCFDRTPDYKNTLDSLEEEIKGYDSLIGKRNLLYFYFPLSYAGKANNKQVLDKILDMQNKGIKIRLTNRMCGSCFPAFYYLVKRGVEYTVNPEQKINPKVNTPQIQACFK